MTEVRWSCATEPPGAELGDTWDNGTRIYVKTVHGWEVLRTPVQPEATGNHHPGRSA